MAESFALQHEKLRWRRIKKDLGRHRSLVQTVRKENQERVEGWNMQGDILPISPHMESYINWAKFD